MTRLFAAMFALACMTASCEAAIYTSPTVYNPGPAGALFYIDLGTPATTSDSITVNGTFFETSGYYPTPSALSFWIYGNTLDASNLLFSAQEASDFSLQIPLADNISRLWFTEYIGGNLFGANLNINIPDSLNPGVLTAVPEPSTWAMLLIGFVVIGLSKARRRKMARLA